MTRQHQQGTVSHKHRDNAQATVDVGTVEEATTCEEETVKAVTTSHQHKHGRRDLSSTSRGIRFLSSTTGGRGSYPAQQVGEVATQGPYQVPTGVEVPDNQHYKYGGEVSAQ